MRKNDRWRKILAMMLAVCMVLTSSGFTSFASVLGVVEQDGQTEEGSQNELKAHDAALASNEPVPIAITGPNTVEIGETVTLTGNGSSSRKHSWSSSNENVASVKANTGQNSNAAVTGVSAGTATITHTYNGGSETFEITVSEPARAPHEVYVYVQVTQAVRDLFKEKN